LKEFSQFPCHAECRHELSTLFSPLETDDREQKSECDQEPAHGRWLYNRLQKQLKISGDDVTSKLILILKNFGARKDLQQVYGHYRTSTWGTFHFKVKNKQTAG
jgi:hypothetical protein